MSGAKVYRAIGLMSGTSLDGIDVALIETDGAGFVKPLAFACYEYDSAIRKQIRAVYGATGSDNPQVKEAEKLSTQQHALAVQSFLEQAGYDSNDIDLIGYHGQTIFHAPKDGLTIQIGDGESLARETGIDVVCDFRTADVKAGGEGAPLAPLYHKARLESADIEKPAVILNIGGVGNVTFIGSGAGSGDHDILAFDTGPGNALMDDWVLKRIGQPFDKDGALAAVGQANEALLEQWLSHEYFSARPPKSLDRDQWDIAALGQVSEEMDQMSIESGAATLLEFTARSIANSVSFMPEKPKNWYACGGGRHNKALMARLGQLLQTSGAGVLKSVEDLGWNGNATEAECFAYLAVRSVLALPITLPGTTGVKQPLTGGAFYKSGSTKAA